jgi:hypothetical protein
MLYFAVTIHKLMDQISGAIVASILMDKQGRKKLLTGSYLGMVYIASTDAFQEVLI